MQSYKYNEEIIECTCDPDTGETDLAAHLGSIDFAGWEAFSVEKISELLFGNQIRYRVLFKRSAQTDEGYTRRPRTHTDDY